MKANSRKLEMQEPNRQNGDSDVSCGRREQRDSEYRRRILAAARDLFERQETATVTMYQIAQAARVGQGTLYRRYAHIGEVISDLLHTTTQLFLTDLESRCSATASNPSALSQLEEVIIRLVHYIDGKAAQLSVISKMYADKKYFLPHKRPITQQIYNILAALLKRAVAQGETREFNIALTTNCLIASFSPEQYMYHRDVLGYTKESFASGLCDLYITGLQKRD